MKQQLYTASLRAGFIGLRFLPNIIAIGTNNLNPKFILHEEYIEYKGAFFTNELAYSAVEKVEAAFIGTGTNNLTITPQTGLTTFTGNFHAREQLCQFLDILDTKGCLLTPITRQILSQYKR